MSKAIIPFIWRAKGLKMTITPEQQTEIDQLRDETFSTRRPISSDLEEILYQAFPVLDHGFVRVIDYMGNDESIVQAARVSYGKGTKKVSEDKGLINYLMPHRHNTVNTSRKKQKSESIKSE